MFGIIKNVVGHRFVWMATLVGGGLLGVGTTASQAQAAYPAPTAGRSYYSPSYVGPNASAAQINRNLAPYTQQQVWNANQRIQNWQYSQYNPYSANYIGNTNYYPYYPYYPYSPLYVAPPSVVYPYVSPYGTGSTVYPSVSPY